MINFELLISSATNRLMNDASHVALDPEGAAIMRGLQSRLVRLQEQMEREPQRHWQIRPGISRRACQRSLVSQDGCWVLGLPRISKPSARIPLTVSRTVVRSYSFSASGSAA